MPFHRGFRVVAPSRFIGCQVPPLLDAHAIRCTHFNSPQRAATLRVIRSIVFRRAQGKYTPSGRLDDVRQQLKTGPATTYVYARRPSNQSRTIHDLPQYRSLVIRAYRRPHAADANNKLPMDKCVRSVPGRRAIDQNPLTVD